MKVAREHVFQALDDHISPEMQEFPISFTYFKNYTIRVESVEGGFDIRAQGRWCDHDLDKELVCRLCGKEFRRV